MSEPWYADGLRFECTQCGRCCTGAPGYVWVDAVERAALAQFLGLGLEDFRRLYTRRARGREALVERANGDCVFYNRGCTVYPARPRQCRSFPFWPENLRDAETWEALREECPGVGRGPLYPLEAIRRIRRGEGEAAAESGR